MPQRLRMANNEDRAETSIRVVVVQASRLYRECFTDTLARHPDFEPIAQVADVETALDVVTELEPDVIVIDGAAPDAPELIRSMVQAAPGAKTIACGVPDEEAIVLACAEACVSGFVSAECPLEELGDNIMAAYRGELRAPGIASMLLRAVADRGKSVSRAIPVDDDLTERESGVVTLIEQGFSNKEIASELALSVSTVKHHVHSILHKLKVRRRSQVAARRRDSTLSVDPRI